MSQERPTFTTDFNERREVRVRTEEITLFGVAASPENLKKVSAPGQEVLLDGDSSSVEGQIFQIDSAWVWVMANFETWEDKHAPFG